METSNRRLPQRRRDLLTREIDGEFVVLDEASEQAHQLSGDIAAVWRAAEAGTWPALPESQVKEIVAELVALGLLQETPDLTRRAMIQRGGAVVALTGLATMSLPMASAFASSGVGVVTTLAVNPQTIQISDTYTASGTVKRSSNAANVPYGSVEIRDNATNVLYATATVSSGTYSVNIAAPSNTKVLKAVYTAPDTFVAGTAPTATITVIGPRLVSVTSGGTGGTAGLMQQGDTLTFVFDEPVTGVNTTSGAYTVTESKSPGVVALSIPNLILDATISSSYVGTATNSSGTAPATAVLSNSNKTVTLTLGVVSTSGGGIRTGSGSVSIFPSTTIKDTATVGNAAAGPAVTLSILF
jgi:hypothetical protein